MGSYFFTFLSLLSKVDFVNSLLLLEQVVKIQEPIK